MPDTHASSTVVARPGIRTVLSRRARSVLSVLITLRKQRRCDARHEAQFLRRQVRCKKSDPHAGDHVFTFLDETVVWDRENT